MLCYSPLCDSDPRLYSQYLAVWEKTVNRYGACGQITGRRFGTFLASVERSTKETIVNGVGRQGIGNMGASVGTDDNAGKQFIGVGIRRCFEVDDKVVDRYVDNDKVGFGRGAISSDDIARVECVTCDDNVEAGTQQHKTNGDTSVSLGAIQGDAMGLKGKHYRRNKVKAQKKKQKRNDLLVHTGCEDGVRSIPQRGGAFVDCDDEVRAELRRTRAEMFIAKNKAETAKAESYVRHVQMVTKSRMHETKFEYNRQTIEEKLRIISEKRLGCGFVESSSVSSSSSASKLASGIAASPVSGISVSPNSSISMAEVKRMNDTILFQSKQLDELKKKNLVELQNMKSKMVDNEKKMNKEMAALRKETAEILRDAY